MAHKIFLVSGATDGIGRATATELARAGGEVILVGRDRAKAERVVGKIKRDSDNEHVSFEVADLSLQSDLHALASRLTNRLEHLDVLINNVGAWFQRRQLSADGIEMTFALNHLGYFLLTGLLLEKLRSAPAGRIVNVSSIAHRGRQINLDDPQGGKRYSGWNAYHASKLAECNACDKVHLPPGPVCPFCFSDDLGWRQASGRGSVSTWTVVHKEWFAAFRDDLPYNAAQIELEEGPRLTANLIGVDNDKITVGMAVEVTFDDITDEVTLPRFRPLS